MHPYENRPDPQAGHTPESQRDPRTAAPWVSPGHPQEPQPGQQAAPEQGQQAASQPAHQTPPAGYPQQGHPGPQANPGPHMPTGPQGQPGPQTNPGPQHPGFTHQPTPPYYQQPHGQGTPPPGWSIGSVATPERPKREHRWMPLVGTAAGAALIASVATAGLVIGFSHPAHTAVSIDSLGATSSEAVPVSGSTVSNPDWEAVANAVRPSVVAIKVQLNGGVAEGSGVVVDTKGHILTNNHVVAGATQGGITVTLSDGRVFPATVAGTDPTTDLAVVSLTNPPSDLKPATLGDSSKVVVGEPVMAVGNPLGLSSTATTGIVSALDRPVSTSEGGGQPVVTNAIQIDAAINPGNSGGPLFDAKGEVIGITSSIASLSQSSGSIGLGFAIPSNLADRIGAELLKDGTASHAFLGVELTDGQATADGVTRMGAKIHSVSPGTPAASADLRAGDVIVAIDNQPVSGAESLTGYVRALAAGQSATLTVVRDGKSFSVDVTFAAMSGSTTSGSQQGQSPSLPSLPWGQGG
ncbi:trypsin-like peptidase domain-containing protein [Isoptericola sp. b441]|uniref:Trypsin-like peptidase domain-containing protein n=1 Tax=Actinotalea lenta TaxID=3064654 RepID=A0ABT9D504_9CELL|nr:trypsin-like peptidase domain-containing protein [Isoptericola sp. b441]MDO8105802.1 trypsin-like peptidase domain-containing protein [Isoptericola sp. b441]